jgi:hypothetical protein
MLIFKAERQGMSYRQIVASGPKRFWLGFITNTPWKGRPLEIQLEFLRRITSSMQTVTGQDIYPREP